MPKDVKEKAKQIAEGWKNVVVKDPLVEAIAKERADICASCDKLKDSTLGIDGLLRCGVCNCPLAMLTRSMSSECKHPEGKKW